MDISSLRGCLQKLVAVNANRQPLSIDLALGLIGAYMLQHEKSTISEWDAMKTYLTYLRSECFKGKKKAIITDSSFSDCVLHIQQHMPSMPFEKKKGSLMSLGLKVIMGVEESGILSFNDKTFVSYATQTIINGKPAQDYIVDGIVNEINDVEACADVVNAQDGPTKLQEKEPSDTNNILVAEKKQRAQNVCTDNSPFIQLYDELVKVDSDNRTKEKYTWQWLLSLDEYNAIKECVGKNKIPSHKKWDNKTACLLALYIGEFYKREYEENNPTPFSQFSENFPNYGFDIYEKLCGALNITPYKRINQAHKYSLYVRGGLPVHYISAKLDKNKSNYFIDGLSKLLDPEDDIDRMVGEDLLEKGSNTASRESYHNRHSIYEYIHALREDEKTWLDSDNDNKDFCNFKENVRKASNKAIERKKFKLFYLLWTFLDNSNIKEFYITPQLRFNPEEDGERHCAVSKQRLANWGIKNPPAQFSMGIELPILDNNLTIEDLSNPDYTIIYDDLTNEPCSLKKDFYSPFKDGYMQLYTDDDPSMASWNSYKGAQAFRWSGILYDRNRYQLLSQNTNININERIGWVTFTDSVTLKDTNKGKDRTFFNSKGKIYARPATQSMHEIIIKSPCLVEGCISLDEQAECTIGEEQCKAYIVKSNGIAFDVFRAADDEKISVSPVVVYKSASDYRDSSAKWQEYDSKKTNLGQGLYVFSLSFGRYITKVNCYVLPHNASISFYNISQPYQIKFNNIINVRSKECLHSNNQGVYNISRNTNSKDNYTFCIGDESGYITLKTHHPKAQTHLYFHGKEIIDKPIIMAYAEDIEVNYISAQTRKKCRLSDYGRAYRALFDALKATTTNNNLTQGFDLQLDEEVKIKIRIYTQDFQRKNNSSVKMMLLDLKSNKTTQYNPDTIGSIEHDSLLFQSLKCDDYQDIYYTPKFIPTNGENVATIVKVEERQKRLTEYVNNNNPMFVSYYAYQQFEIACEHKIYFAVFDAILCICWDGNKKVYLDRDGKKFKDNLYAFLEGYITHIDKESKEPSVAGLRRFAKEFLFDWKNIKNNIKKSNSDKLKELYQEIINN